MRAGRLIAKRFTERSERLAVRELDAGDHIYEPSYERVAVLKCHPDPSANWRGGRSRGRRRRVDVGEW